MKNTCDYKNCEFGKLLFDKPEQCVNYVESWWTPNNKDNPILIKDCSHKRLFLMVQDLSNRLVGVQKSQEEQRNENMWVQVVAEVLGKNSGIDLSSFVKERQRLQNMEKLQLEDKIATKK